MFGMTISSRVGSLRGTEAPPKSVYYMANAVTMASQMIPFPFVRLLPWAAIPAQAVVERYEKDDGTAARVGQNLRVPLLRRGPVATARTKEIMSFAVTCLSVLTIFPPLQPAWFICAPLGMYVGGIDVEDETTNDAVDDGEE